MSFSVQFEKLNLAKEDGAVTPSDVVFKAGVIIPKSIEVVAGKEDVPFVCFFKLSNPVPEIIEGFSSNGQQTILEVLSWLLDASDYFDKLLQTISTDQLQNKDVLSNFMDTIMKVAVNTQPLNQVDRFFQDLEVFIVDNDEQFVKFLKVHNVFAKIFESQMGQAGEPESFLEEVPTEPKEEGES